MFVGSVNGEREISVRSVWQRQLAAMATVGAHRLGHQSRGAAFDTAFSHRCIVLSVSALQCCVCCAYTHMFTDRCSRSCAQMCSHVLMHEHRLRIVSYLNTLSVICIKGCFLCSPQLFLRK